MVAGPVLPAKAKEKGGHPMKQLVRLRMRPSRDGNSFAYFIDYKDENGKRKRVSLGHADRQKAKRQQAEKERELRMGVVEPQTLRLSDFVTDSLATTGEVVPLAVGIGLAAG
jgi:hypothetical protein